MSGRDIMASWAAQRHAQRAWLLSVLTMAAEVVIALGPA
jgi:hypothetical protein